VLATLTKIIKGVGMLLALREPLVVQLEKWIPEEMDPIFLVLVPIGYLCHEVQRHNCFSVTTIPVSTEPVNTAAFTPTTLPPALRSGPPELPGLIAASVIMREESRFETVPKLTDRFKPKGLPTAITQWPIFGGPVEGL
jgi:hypothetical protein